MATKTIINSVALYLVDRAYGGPEEGGWWYDTGALVDLQEAWEIAGAYALPRFWSIIDDPDEEDDDLQYEEMLLYVSLGNFWLDDNPNKGRRPIDSVLSEGWYKLCIVEGHPQSWPTERPRYE